jgi:hypothetical protein
MVLADLGSKLTVALRKARRCSGPRLDTALACDHSHAYPRGTELVCSAQMGQSARVDEEAMEACLKEVTKALLEVRDSCSRSDCLGAQQPCRVCFQCARRQLRDLGSLTVPGAFLSPVGRQRRLGCPAEEGAPRAFHAGPAVTLQV